MRKRIKQSLIFICIVALLVSLMPGVLAYGNASDWAKEELDIMDSLGLIPQELEEKEDLRTDITRLEMCGIAVLSYETLTGQEIAVTEEKPFTDTDSPIAAKAWAAGLVNGYGDGTFRPDNVLTRQEFFCFVCQFPQSTGWQAQDIHYGDLSAFTDWAQVSDWATEAAKVVVGIGVVRGTGTTLSPGADTTCEQALMMFCRAYLFLVKDALASNPDFDARYPNMADWAKAELKPMDDAGLIPAILLGRDMASNITRKEACYVATTAFFALYPEYLPENVDSPFTDVDDTIITTAHTLGIISGYPDGTFRPDEPITREQFFKIIGNFLMIVGYYRVDDITVDLTIFSDADTLQEYALPSTRLLYSMGVVNGSSGELKPKSNTQCQQALALFYRTYTRYEQWIADVEDEEKNGDGRAEAEELVEFAVQFVGCDYVWGAEDPESGFDCSGLVYYVYRHFGYKIGRTATVQWNYEDGWMVNREDLLPGGLDFFYEDNPDKITHVGIYIGGGQFLHAANSKRGVVIDSIDDAYYVNHYYGAIRIIP